MKTDTLTEARSRLDDARRDLTRLVDRLHDGDTTVTSAAVFQMTQVDRLARELRRLTQAAA